MSGGCGGEPVAEGLPLVLDERVLLEHNGLEAQRERGGCVITGERHSAVYGVTVLGGSLYLQCNQQLVEMCHTVQNLLGLHRITLQSGVSNQSHYSQLRQCEQTFDLDRLINLLWINTFSHYDIMSQTDLMVTMIFKSPVFLS